MLQLENDNIAPAQFRCQIEPVDYTENGYANQIKGPRNRDRSFMFELDDQTSELEFYQTPEKR